MKDTIFIDTDEDLHHMTAKDTLQVVTTHHGRSGKAIGSAGSAKLGHSVTEHRQEAGEESPEVSDAEFTEGTEEAEEVRLKETDGREEDEEERPKEIDAEEAESEEAESEEAESEEAEAENAESGED